MKNPPVKIKKHVKLRIFLVILLALVIAGAAWGTVAKIKHAHAVNQERTQFTQAEKDLDTISSNIIAKFGTPEQNIKSKNCGRTSGFGGFGDNGDLYCYVKISFVYAADLNQAIQIAKGIGKVLPQTVKSTATTDIPLKGVNYPTPLTLGGATFESKNNFSCNLEYNYYVMRDSGLGGYPDLNGAPSGILISSDCGERPAPAAIFPLED